MSLDCSCEDCLPPVIKSLAELSFSASDLTAKQQVDLVETKTANNDGDSDRMRLGISDDVQAKIKVFPQVLPKIDLRRHNRQDALP